MDKENLTNLYSFDSEIKETGEILYPIAKLKELNEKGFKNIHVVVLGSAEKAVSENGLDISLFNKIKELQVLPDSVVADFLSSKGVLYSSDIAARIEY